MKETAFIVCEYNPFHNGHLQHLNRTRDAGAKRIVCIMSGNFVQRGEIAVCDKFTRARFAVQNGADLVVELPAKYVLSGAGHFARGAVEVIKQTGLAGTLSFGASASAEMLSKAVEDLSAPYYRQAAAEYCLKQGVTFASALQRIAEEQNQNLAEILRDPNNILAIEYLQAIKDIGVCADYHEVKREVRHDSDDVNRGICSAKKIRELIYCRSWTEVEAVVPQNVYEVLLREEEQGMLPGDKEKFSAAAMAVLCNKTADDLLKVNAVNQGLENRILSCIKNESDLFALYDAVKTKRYTHARIRQILVSSILGINKASLEQPQPYIRVLGMSQTGRAMIHELREKACVPVIMNLSEAPRGEARTLDERCGKLYDICRPRPMKKNTEYAGIPYVSE